VVCNGDDYNVTMGTTEAMAKLAWREMTPEKREAFQERAKKWYWSEFEQQGGTKHYTKPRWMRLMLSLGFSEKR
jgi:hypothetical protein